MPSYHVCPVCKEVIEVEEYKRHLETHGERKDDSVDLERLKRILGGAKEAFDKKKRNALFIFFEIARRVFSEMEGVDTSSWDYMLDYQVPHIVSEARPSVPSPYPPTMCHIRFKVKDKELFDKLCKKYRGTKEEAILKQMVSQNIPVIIVYGKNWANLILQWKSEGKTSTDIEMLTVYFFLHEMYHIMGFGEKDATTKASMIMYHVFEQTIGIPEHEIKRWEYEEKLKREK